MFKKIALASLPLLLTGAVAGTVMTATAEPSNGTVTIIRTVRGDSSATPVPGIPLNIYAGTNTSTQPIKRIISSDRALSITLPQGQYTLVEPGAARYTSPQNKNKIPLTFAVSSTSPAHVVYAGPSALLLQPQTRQGQPVNSGGQYRVTTCQGTPVSVLTPNGSPESRTTVVPQGCLKVSVITPPKGMKTTQPVTQQTVSNGPTRVVLVLPGSPRGISAPVKQGSSTVILKSRVRGSETPLPRATYNFIDCTTGATKARATTGDNGQTSFTLRQGCYRVKQHSPVKGYDMDATEQEFTLMPGSTIITVSNRKTGDSAQPVSAVPIIATSDKTIGPDARVIGGQSGASSHAVSSIPAGRRVSPSEKCVIPSTFA